MAGPSRKSTEVPPPSALRSRADNEAHRAYEQIAHEVGERANALMYERAFEKGRPATEFSVPSSASAQEARRAGVPVFTERPVPSIQIIGTDRSYLGSTHEEAHLAAEAAGEDLRPDLRRPRYMQHVYFDGYDVFDQAKGTRRFVGCSEGEYLLRYK